MVSASSFGLDPEGFFCPGSLDLTKNANRYYKMQTLFYLAFSGKENIIII